MDDNEREDRIGQRIFWFFISILLILPISLGGTFILLHYGQGQLLSDIVKIMLGAVGGLGRGFVPGDENRHIITCLQ